MLTEEQIKDLDNIIVTDLQHLSFLCSNNKAYDWDPKDDSNSRDPKDFTIDGWTASVELSFGLYLLEYVFNKEIYKDIIKLQLFYNNVATFVPLCAKATLNSLIEYHRSFK